MLDPLVMPIQHCVTNDRALYDSQMRHMDARTSVPLPDSQACLKTYDASQIAIHHIDMYGICNMDMETATEIQKPLSSYCGYPGQKQHIQS